MDDVALPARILTAVPTQRIPVEEHGLLVLAIAKLHERRENSVQDEIISDLVDTLKEFPPPKELPSGQSHEVQR